jgi:hypothetical protein
VRDIAPRRVGDRQHPSLERRGREHPLLAMSSCSSTCSRTLPPMSARAPASKLTPCLRRLLAALRSSHSKFVGRYMTIVYTPAGAWSTSRSSGQLTTSYSRSSRACAASRSPIVASRYSRSRGSCTSPAMIRSAGLPPLVRREPCVVPDADQTGRSTRARAERTVLDRIPWSQLTVYLRSRGENSSPAIPTGCTTFTDRAISPP